MNDLFAEYSRVMLSFRLGDADSGYDTRPAPPEALAPILRQAARVAGQAGGAADAPEISASGPERDGRSAGEPTGPVSQSRSAAPGHCVLLGVGRGDFARELATRLPIGCGLTVCELSLEQARVHGRDLPLLADGSATALVWLLLSAGLTRGRTFCVLNPEIADSDARDRLKSVQKLHAAFAPLEISPASGRKSPGPSLSLAAILSPYEPDLDGFFAALPSWADEAVVVWDAASPPETPPPSPVPVMHLAHPLERDFAAQRNRMLAACRGDWVLYLDGDERLDDALAGLLPDMLAQETCRSFALPRLAIDSAGVKTGWGLWPDFQVRLFRRDAGLRFVRPVHERLEGLSGPTGLVAGAYIRHLAGLLKSREELERKLALFDQAGGFSGQHRQNADFPRLPEAFFSTLTTRPFLGTWPEAVRFAPL